MAASESITPVLAILVSLGAALVILALHQRPNLRDATSVIAAVIKFLLVISMAPMVLRAS
jgi:hypothetical protein